MGFWEKILGNTFAERRAAAKKKQMAKENPYLFVADEIKKLNELRKEGIITNEEFKAQKQRLLAQKKD